MVRTRLQTPGTGGNVINGVGGGTREAPFPSDVTRRGGGSAGVLEKFGFLFVQLEEAVTRSVPDGLDQKPS